LRRDIGFLSILEEIIRWKKNPAKNNVIEKIKYKNTSRTLAI